MDKSGPFQPMKNAKVNPVIFFDGVCNLCNGFVQFVIRHDPQAKFRFASLQSEHARDIPRMVNKEGKDERLSTVILAYRGVYYSKSGAVLRITKLLGFPYNFLYGFMILPKPLRDFIYDWVATNRYKWFGKRAACMMPTPELKQRFL